MVQESPFRCVDMDAGVVGRTGAHRRGEEGQCCDGVIPRIVLV